MQEVKITCTHSEGRSKDFFRFHLYKISPMKYLYYGISILCVFIGFYFLYTLHYEGSVFFILLGIITYFIRIVITNYTISSIIKKLSLPAGSYDLIFTNEGITYKYLNSIKNYSWKDVYRVYQTDNYLYLYINPSNAIIVVLYQVSSEDKVVIKKLILDNKLKYYQYQFK